MISGKSLPAFVCARAHLAFLASLAFWGHCAFLAVWALGAAPAHAGPAAGDPVVEAREALRVGDKAKLSALRQTAVSAGHPLALWVDYWDLSQRLTNAQGAEVEAFYERWPRTYVEDRLRNDWLLELGRRRDWAAFLRDWPRFKMRDDREVACYHLWAQLQSGQDVREAGREAGREAWWAQRESDDGCHQLATALFAAKRLSAADVWHKARLGVEANRTRAARAAVGLLGTKEERAAAEAIDKPLQVLGKKPNLSKDTARQLTVLALMRLASNDPPMAAQRLQEALARGLPSELAAIAWASVAKQSALKQLPQASEWYARAWSFQSQAASPVPWSDDTLAWWVRANLRSDPNSPQRWAHVLQAIEVMSAAEQKDPAWVYWKARALQARAGEGPSGEASRAMARHLLQTIASPLSFYGKLASEDLGSRIVLPPPPSPLTVAERQAAQDQPGLQRGLQLLALGLRSEGVREWNFSLRGMGDRELLAAAQMACDRQVWDRCINASDRTRHEIDLAQRFPMPFRDEVMRTAKESGLDPAYMYGLIRQESRFVTDARSHVGASGLMQVMPATARWTAKKIGLPWKSELLNDRDVNLKIGASYLKWVLDDFGGSVALAAAAYNAGPGRPRRWREGPELEAAAWAESIPFTGTRDYVKKVLSNTALYAALLKQDSAPSLKQRLGPSIGPRDAKAPPPNQELP